MPNLLGENTHVPTYHVLSPWPLKSPKNPFCPNSIKPINKVDNHVRKHPFLSLKYQLLDFQSLIIQEYSDASFSNTDDLKSQLGFIIFLVDKTNFCHILHFSRKSSKRVLGFLLAANNMLFSILFTKISHFPKTWKEWLTVPSLLLCYPTHSLSSTISQNVHIPKKKLLMIDLTSICDACNADEISNAGFVGTSQNQIHHFTKLKHCEYLNTILTINVWKRPVGTMG